jgi:hypothetical protein
MDQPHRLKGCDHVFCRTCLDTMASTTTLAKSCPLCRCSNPLSPDYNTPLSILDAYIQKTYKTSYSETEKRALFDHLIPAKSRQKALAYRMAYQTWRRKHFLGAKGEFSDLVHFRASQPSASPAAAT